MGRNGFPATIIAVLGLIAALLVLHAQAPSNRFVPDESRATGSSELTTAIPVSSRPSGAVATSLFSDVSNKIIDLRDFGLQAIQTTGSMTAGSNQLILPASAGFAVGDHIIVAVGGEAGAGMRGTPGAWGRGAAAPLPHHHG